GRGRFNIYMIKCTYIFNNTNLIFQVNARILPTPTIQYHTTSKEASIRPSSGVWNLQDKKVATGATLGSWIVVAFVNENGISKHVIKMFVRELVSTCQYTGMVS